MKWHFGREQISHRAVLKLAEILKMTSFKMNKRQNALKSLPQSASLISRAGKMLKIKLPSCTAGRSCEPCPHHPSSIWDQLRFIWTDRRGNASTEERERQGYTLDPPRRGTGTDRSQHKPSSGEPWPKTAPRRWQEEHLCPVAARTAHTCFTCLVTQKALSKCQIYITEPL